LISNIGEAAASFVVRFLDGVSDITERTITLNGEAGVSVSVPWNASSIGPHDITVSLDPANSISEQREDNNLAVKTVSVVQAATTTLSIVTTTTSIAFPPTPSDVCVMPGNTPPCNEVTLTEVVAGITEWSKGNMQLKEVLAIINSWADPLSYPPV